MQWSAYRDTGSANYYVKGVISLSSPVVVPRNDPREVTAAPSGESWGGRTKAPPNSIGPYSVLLQTLHNLIGSTKLSFQLGTCPLQADTCSARGHQSRDVLHNLPESRSVTLGRAGPGVLLSPGGRIMALRSAVTQGQ